MRYYSYCEYNENDPALDIEVTVSEQEIRDVYWPYWYNRMCVRFGRQTVDEKYTFEDCLDDWIVVNWAYPAKLNIGYSLNWMGPLSIDWYKSRGLTKTVTVTVEPDSWLANYNGYKAGDTIIQDEIIEQYSCGRIDVSGVPDEPYGLEIGVPVMRHDSWHLFGNWLQNFTTDRVYTLCELVTEYQKTNLKICWYRDEHTT
jgi:hypothetical protein